VADGVLGVLAEDALLDVLPGVLGRLLEEALLRIGGRTSGSLRCACGPAQAASRAISESATNRKVMRIAQARAPPLPRSL